jgi:hypothetical protein
MPYATSTKGKEMKIIYQFGLIVRNRELTMSVDARIGFPTPAALPVARTGQG